MGNKVTTVQYSTIEPKAYVGQLWTNGSMTLILTEDPMYNLRFAGIDLRTGRVRDWENSLEALRRSLKTKGYNPLRRGDSVNLVVETVEN